MIGMILSGQLRHQIGFDLNRQNLGQVICNASISLEITCFIGVNKTYFYVWVNLTNFN